MSNIPTARDSAIEAAWIEVKRKGFQFGRDVFVSMIRESKDLRENVDLLERAIDADRQYRIADAIMQSVKP